MDLQHIKLISFLLIHNFKHQFYVMKSFLMLVISIVFLTACEVEDEKIENEISTDIEEVVFDDSETIELTEDLNEIWEISERFVSNGKVEIVFEHMNYQNYRLYEDGVLTESGTMFSEEGYLGDENGRSYYLGTNLPMEDQRSVVKEGNSDTLKMYDSEAMLVEGVNFIER